MDPGPAAPDDATVPVADVANVLAIAGTGVATSAMILQPDG